MKGTSARFNGKHGLGPKSGRGFIRREALAASSGLAVVLAAVGGVAFAALPPVPQPVGNPSTEQKRILGKILFFDEQLSATNTMACATCHVIGRAGSDPRQATNPGPDNLLNTPDDRRASPGVIRSDINMNYLPDSVFDLQPQVTPRTANSPINAAYAPELFWDGRASGTFKDPVSGQVVLASGAALESQSVNPPMSTSEMAHDGIDWAAITAKLEHVRPLDLATNHPGDIAARMASSPSYADLFTDAFGDSQITAARIGMAIAVYERTLIADDTPWDRTQNGQPNGLTPQQNQGWQAFQASQCIVCHAAPLFTGNGFRNVGLRPPAEDRGRADVSGNNADRGKFKVPGLRNVGLKQSFMHNGQIASIDDVIRFYARAPGAAPQFPENQDPVMQQVNVPPQVAPALAEFLRNGLLDTRVRDQVFPFDRPTLASERQQNRTTIVANTGTGGSGGFVPRIIADMPPMLGTADWRVGIDLARGGATAQLVYSTSAPANGKITPTAVIGTVTASSGGSGDGFGTFHWELSPTKFFNGQVIFLQWIVTDTGAAGGQAWSQVARVPLFCGSGGCPGPCAADFDGSGFLDFDDYSAFVGAFEAGSDSADFDKSGFVDFDDFIFFVQAYETGC